MIVMRHINILGYITCILLQLMIGAKTYGVELNAKEIRGRSKKSPVAVLQNRYFTKTYRPEVGVAAGTFLNEAYTDTWIQGFRASMFLSEWFGIEAQMFDTSVADSDDRKALNELQYRKLDSAEIVSPDPEVNPIYSVMDYSAVIAPFYGKINFMDKMILYSDLYFSSGLSFVDTAQGELSAITLGMGQRFYFLKMASLRVDFRDRIYKEQRSGESTTKHAYSVDFGVSYFFL